MQSKVKCKTSMDKTVEHKQALLYRADGVDGPQEMERN